MNLKRIYIGGLKKTILSGIVFSVIVYGNGRHNKVKKKLISNYITNFRQL